MNELGQALDTYLALRRALGFKLDNAEKRLRNFVEYMQGKQSSIVTTVMALAWVNQSKNVSPATRAEHLSVVRNFARHLHASEPLHEVPPVNLFPRQKTRHLPYIYSDEDVTALLGAAQGFRHPLKASTYTTLFGLLAVTGMRVGEARANTPRTRNNRLAAIHSFFRFIAIREPAYNALIQRVLTIPNKRFDRKLVCFLTRFEIDALLAAPDQTSWSLAWARICRDHTDLSGR